MRRHPFFIIGSPRSGTTLFRLMLTCHPRLVVPPEGTFALHLAKQRSDRNGLPEIERFVDRVLAHPKMELWGMDRQALLQYLRNLEASDIAGLSAGVYEFYGRSQAKHDFIWGDKNNTYLNSIVPISRLFPDAVFLHIVRDGRDVACSYRSLSDVRGKYAPRLPQTVPGAALDWAHNLRTIRRGFDSVGWDRVHEIRYEDLVGNPEEVLAGVCRFLGVAYSDEMLAYHEDRNAGLEPSAYDPWKELTKYPLTGSSIERWRDELSSGQVQAFEYLAGSLLTRYSYELSADEPDLATKAALAGIRLRFMWKVKRRAARKMAGKLLRRSARQ